MAASDALFQALAQALGRPSKAYRAAIEGLAIPDNAVTGYLTGKERGQELAKYRLLETPLGQIFPDPASIPGGLTPNHRVSDLLNLTPVLPYVPTSAGGQILTSMAGGNPAQTAPLGGTSPQQPTPGSQNLNAIQGTGAGAQNNVPAGTPTATALPPTPSISMASPMDLQRFGPMMNDIRQGRQFQQQQNNEDRRQATSIVAENARQGNTINEQQKQKEAELRKEYETGNTSVMSALDAYKQLEDAWNKVPLSQKGPGIGTALTHAGDIASGKFPEAVAYNKARLQLAGAITAGIDPKGRQGPSLLDKILQGIPTLGQSDQTRNDLMKNIYNQTTSQANRNFEGYQAAAGSVGRTVPRPNLPSSNGTSTSNESPVNSNKTPIMSFASESDVPQNLPKGTIIKVRGRRAVIR